MNIRPSAAIRQNYNEIADICRKTAEPVFLTKNGEGDLVVMDIETYDCGVVSEQFLDKNGKTILWRRFNRDDWAIDRYKKLWSEQLPENDKLTVNGTTYVHWYDCITDYIL